MRSGWQTERQRSLPLAADDTGRPLTEARARTSHLFNVDIQWLQLPAAVAE